MIGMRPRQVIFNSKNPTPELPLLEAAASELAAIDNLDLLPAAAFDSECQFAATNRSTPATTLPATPSDEDTYSSCGSDGLDFAQCLRKLPQSVSTLSCEAYWQEDGYVPMWCRLQCENGKFCITPCAGGTDEDPPDTIDSYERLWCWVQVTDTGTFIVPCTSKDAEQNFESFELPVPTASFELTALPEGWLPQLSSESCYVPEWVPGPYWPFNVLPTTLVLSNVPPELTQECLLEVLDREEFSGLYDFVVLQDGHALVNATRHEYGIAMASRLHGRCSWGIGKETCACRVSWCLSVQGLADLVRTYRDAPENQPNVPEQLRPQLFSGGWPVPFSPSSTDMLDAKVWMVESSISADAP